MGFTDPNIVEFVTDPQLLNLTVSVAQETLLRAMYGLPLTTQDQRDAWQVCSGGRRYREGHRPAEVSVISGARGGKGSRIEAPPLCYEATFGHHERHLGRGERGTIPLVSQDSRANAVMRGYVFDYMRHSPVLSTLIEDERRDELALSNRMSVVCFPNTAGSLRAWSIPAAGMDEVAFWRLDGAADSDVEIQAAIRRGMVGFPRTLLVKCSTPYMRGGLLHSDFERAFGKDDPDLLVWRAPSVVMNPTLGAGRLAREQRLDPVRFRREYEAEWIDDLDAFVPPTWVEAAVVKGRRELPPRSDTDYAATTDPIGGGPDEWPIHIYHVEHDSRHLVVDVLRAHRRVGTEAPDLEGIVREYAAVLRRYRCDMVVGDRYAGAWVRQAFERQGIRYEDAPCDKSRAYLELHAWLAQGRVELPDDPVLTRQLTNLERRARPGGRDMVDHPRGQHDDRANVVALAAALVSREDEDVPLMLLGSADHRDWEARHHDDGRVGTPIASERAELLTLFEPLCLALENGDTDAAKRAESALEAHLASVEETDASAGARVRRLSQQVQDAIARRVRATA
jgi:hypothetical protein